MREVALRGVQVALHAQLGGALFAWRRRLVALREQLQCVVDCEHSLALIGGNRHPDSAGAKAKVHQRGLIVVAAARRRGVFERSGVGATACGRAAVRRAANAHALGSAPAASGARRNHDFTVQRLVPHLPQLADKLVMQRRHHRWVARNRP